MARGSFPVRSFAVAVAFAALAAAQCAPQWASGLGIPGVSGEVHAATTWDPDGPGPATPRIAVAGIFFFAGSAVAERVAAYDPTTDTWEALGVGPLQVLTMIGMPSGDLVVGGTFSSAGGVPANRLAVWRNGAWSQYAGGADGAVHTFALLPSGDLLVGGWVGQFGGTPINLLARWDGSAWHPFGSPFDWGIVRALAVLPNGDVMVGGDMGLPILGSRQLVRWSGGPSWDVLVSSGAPTINTLAALPDGSVAIGGWFPSLGGVASPNAIRWAPSGFVPMGGGLAGEGDAMACLSNGHVVAGGFCGLGSGQSPCNVARWDGSTWTTWNDGANTAVTTSTSPLRRAARSPPRSRCRAPRHCSACPSTSSSIRSRSTRA